MDPAAGIVGGAQPIESDLETGAAECLVGGDAGGMPERLQPRPGIGRGRKIADLVCGMHEGPPSGSSPASAALRTWSTWPPA